MPEDRDLESKNASTLALDGNVATKTDKATDVSEEGGLQAWLTVFALFVAVMNTWGMIISFGVFQTYYLSRLNQSRSDIAWIGSIAVFFLFFMGIVGGRLTDAGYYRITTLTGTALVVLGTFMTSISNTYWQIFLAQGVCTGLGNGFLLTPMSTVVASHFRKKIPLVMGIAACGSVTEGLIYPSMVRTLLPRIGFGWTLRAIAFIQLGTLAAALVLAKPKSVSKNTAPIIDLMVFKEPAFALLFVGSFFAFLGIFFPFFFLSSYAREKQGMSYEDSLNLTLILNGIGFAGRLLPSVLARFFGTLNVFIGTIFASAICMFTWIPIHSTTGLYVWTAFNSMAVGGVQSLSLAVVPVITTDMSKIGARLGIIFAAIGVGALIGSPICGIIIASNYGSYTGAQTFSGGALVLGGSIMIGAREARRREIHNSIWARI